MARTGSKQRQAARERRVAKEARRHRRHFNRDLAHPETALLAPHAKPARRNEALDEDVARALTR
jgi:hypothetical protein